MRLRKQLFFLSLITLALPWVGCQTVREMDNSLRTAQLSSLNATASAVAARFAADDKLRETLASHSGSRQSIYAHALKAPIYLDGYGEDDWLGQDIELQALLRASQGDKVAARFALGVTKMAKDTLYGFVKVESKDIRYFRPSDSSLANTDYLRLDTREEAFALFASAPGRLTAERLTSTPATRKQRAVHQIKGFWVESQNGFQLEFSLPLNWALTGLQLSLVNGSDAQGADQADKLPEIATLVTPSPELGRELAVFAKADTRLQILTLDRYRLAKAGHLSARNQRARTHGFLSWLYTRALGKPNFPAIDARSGRLSSEVAKNALKGEDSQAWYRRSGLNLAQAGAPIIFRDEILGAVVVEQSESSLTHLTDDAFGRLLGYSFFIALLAALFLVGYATLLSVRIRRLNDAARGAISEGGKIAETFPVSNSADEIGELSRSYDQLLSRLREYTQYLRSLSSKLSHELRTPLAIVRSSLDNLEHEDIHGKAAEYSARAKEGAYRLSHILNAMSAASRVEQAIEHAETELLDCHDLLKDLLAAYGSVYHHHQFRLLAEPATQPLKILASPELLVQALDKLVDNAADFSEADAEIVLELDSDKDVAIFRVHNRGPLLPEHMRGQLFDSMVSLRQPSAAARPAAKPESARNRDTHHLGLGLYIVRLICDFHGGEARAYNNVALDGVVFELRFPRAHVSPPSPEGTMDSMDTLDKQS